MITLYGGATPNARKISIALEEMALPWRLEVIDILRGDQLTPEFIALNPNNKAPVIVDDDPQKGIAAPFVLWESGAILLYLAEKAGQFFPVQSEARAICLQWLMFQMSGVGPMFGQNAHFEFYAAERHAYAMERYAREVDRLLLVLEGRLAQSPYLAGPDYTIADMATFPYLQRQLALKSDRLPNLARWADAIRARPAVARGMQVGLAELRAETIEGGLKGFSDEHRSILFGEKQFERFRPR
jgi:GSH-dependent disulfide-bond oxidoreductase